MTNLNGDASTNNSVQFLFETFNALNEGIIVQNRQGEINLINDSAANILVLDPLRTKEETIKEAFSKMCFEDGIPLNESEHPISVTFQSGTPLKKVIMSYPKGNGEIIWLSIDTSPLRNESGDIYAVVIAIIDITSRKILEQERDRLIAVIESTPDFVSTADLNGKVQYMNQGVRKICGSNGGDGREIEHIRDAHPDWVNKLLNDIAIPTAIRDGIWIGETAFKCKEGKEMPVSQIILAHKSNTGNVEYLSTIARNIYDQKQIETKHKLIQEIAEIVSSAKNFESAKIEVLKKVCTTAGWPYAEAWLLDEKTQELKLNKGVYAEDDERMAFFESSKKYTFRKGEGLPGSAWEIGSTVWVHDLKEEFYLPRLKMAIEARFTSAMAFPILSQNVTVGVMCFFIETPRSTDRDFAQLFSIIARELGSFFQKKKTEDMLWKLSTAAQFAADPIFITDVNGIIEYVNPAFEQVSEFTKEELLGMTPRVLKSGSQPESYYRNLWNTILAGNVHRSELVEKSKSGKIFHIEQTISPVKDTDGKITHFISTSKDITYRRKIEADLKNIEFFSDSILNSLSASICVVNNAGVITSVNHNWRKFALQNGANESTIIGVGLNYLEASRRAFELGDELAGQILEGIQSVLDGKTKKFRLEYPCHSQFENRWYVMHVVPLKTSMGGVVISHQNITDRKLAEIELIESQNRFFNAFEYAPIGMVMANLKGNFIKTNPAFRELIGYTKGELLMMNVRDITHEGDFGSDMESAKELLHGTKNTYTADKRYIRKDGKIVEAKLSVSLIFDQQKQPFYYIAQILDVTENKRYCESIESQNAILRDIAWTQSHIVRAPLARLMSLIQFLDETESPEFTHEQAKIEILKSANELDNIIKEIAQKSQFLKE